MSSFVPIRFKRKHSIGWKRQFQPMEKFQPIECLLLFQSGSKEDIPLVENVNFNQWKNFNQWNVFFCSNPVQKKTFHWLKTSISTNRTISTNGMSSFVPIGSGEMEISLSIGWNWRNDIEHQFQPMECLLLFRSDPVRRKSAFPLVEIDVTILNINFNQWDVFFCSDRIRRDGNQPLHWLKLT